MGNPSLRAGRNRGRPADAPARCGNSHARCTDTPVDGARIARERPVDGTRIARDRRPSGYSTPVPVGQTGATVFTPSRSAITLLGAIPQPTSAVPKSTTTHALPPAGRTAIA